MNDERQVAQAGASQERPSFFSIPPGMRFFAHAGGRFWGGALAGLGLGTGLLGPLLADPEAIPHVWVRWTARALGLVAFALGLAIARRAVELGRQPESDTRPSA